VFYTDHQMASDDESKTDSVERLHLEEARVTQLQIESLELRLKQTQLQQLDLQLQGPVKISNPTNLKKHLDRASQRQDRLRERNERIRERVRTLEAIVELRKRGASRREIFEFLLQRSKTGEHKDMAIDNSQVTGGAADEDRAGEK
jgi:hypothetical protein